MYTRDRVSAFSPLGVRYAVGHYSFMIWPVIISTMEVVCGNKDRSQHMQAREAQAQERGREMEQIYGAWYSHFARSCYTFWARGFPDMIEFECTLPYTKVSACCVNISCKHFVSIRDPYRGNNSTDCTFTVEGASRCRASGWKNVRTEEEHIAGQGSGKKNTKKNQAKCQKRRCQQLSVWMFWAVLSWAH